MKGWEVGVLLRPEHVAFILSAIGYDRDSQKIFISNGIELVSVVSNLT